MRNLNSIKVAIALLLVRVATRAFALSQRLMGKPFAKVKTYPAVSPMDNRSIYGYVTILTEKTTNHVLHCIENNPLYPIIVVRDDERETVGYHHFSY